MLQNFDVFNQDAVILDLEDAVIASEKDAARELVNQLLVAFQPDNVEVIIRINPFDTPEYIKDIELIMNAAVNTLMIPKATYSDVVEILKDIKNMELKYGREVPIKIIPIIESAKAILDIEMLAGLERVDGLLLGAEDLMTDLEIKRSSDNLELLYVRNRIGIASRIFQIDGIDTPYVDVLDEEGLVEDCIRAKQLALNAKACIHPNQVIHVNKIFAPSQEEITYALRVIAAANSASKEQKGAFSMDGKMIDKPIIDRANKVLAKARKFNLV